ncbi:MAG: glutamyl-tRNA reductase [Oscillospiraceae bacterium]|nr:glutamyl-tRNA reductase [Oscillospiraceae bacterium]
MDEPNIECISVSFRTAPSHIRGRLAFTEETQRKFLKKACENRISQCVIICTCNRTEVYYCGMYESAIGLLADFGGFDVRELTPLIMRFCGKNAFFHLYRVACGIDSMVIGEDEILGQTKSAYSRAKEENTAGFELNRVFLGAISCAKKIKTETALSKTSVSVATLAANEAVKFSEKPTVLLIGGSGKTGSIMLKNLISHRHVSIYVTERSHNEDLNTFRDIPQIHIIDYSHRYSVINDCSCIISATSSPHHTITAQGLSENNVNNSHRLFIDLAVPADIEKSAAEESGARLMGIDYFEQLSAENNALKQDSVEYAKKIIENCADELFKEFAFHSFLLLMREAEDKFTSVGFEKLIYKLKSDLTSSEFSALLKSLKSDLEG